MNGAIGGSGALISTGCVTSLLGDINLDVIIVEYAVNDQSEVNVRSLVRVLQRNYVNSAIIILQVTSRLIRELGAPGWWPAGANVAHEYHLPYVNWSAMVDIGYNRSFEPVHIWPDDDPQHPNRLGAHWIAGSVLMTMEAVYRHSPAAKRNGKKALPVAHLPDIHPHVDHSDVLCISEFCMGLLVVPRDLEENVLTEMDTDFDSYATAGSCWRRHHFRHAVGREGCHGSVRQYDASACDSETESVITFNLTLKRRCRLFVAVVGNPHGSALTQCNLDVLLHNAKAEKAPKVIGRVRMAVEAYVIQTEVEVALVQPGVRVISLVPVGRKNTHVGEEEEGEEHGDMCNLSTVMCIPP
jgi:hypothetical protein